MLGQVGIVGLVFVVLLCLTASPRPELDWKEVCSVDRCQTDALPQPQEDEGIGGFLVRLTLEGLMARLARIVNVALAMGTLWIVARLVGGRQADGPGQPDEEVVVAALVVVVAADPPPREEIQPPMEEEAVPPPPPPPPPPMEVAVPPPRGEEIQPPPPPPPPPVGRRRRGRPRRAGPGPGPGPRPGPGPAVVAVPAVPAVAPEEEVAHRLRSGRVVRY